MLGGVIGGVSGSGWAGVGWVTVSGVGYGVDGSDGVGGLRCFNWVGCVLLFMIMFTPFC